MNHYSLVNTAVLFLIDIIFSDYWLAFFGQSLKRTSQMYPSDKAETE